MQSSKNVFKALAIIFEEDFLGLPIAISCNENQSRDAHGG